MTENFSIARLSYSDTAKARGIDNAPPLSVMENMRLLAEGLERVMALLGHPISLNSGYRCPLLNRAVGGSLTSDHMNGLAADFTCAAFGTPLEVVKAIIDSDIEFDQCIFEKSWVHISFNPRLRRRILTAHFGPDGKVTHYTEGVA